jgi:hypothetical protein
MHLECHQKKQMVNGSALGRLSTDLNISSRINILFYTQIFAISTWAAIIYFHSANPQFH